MSTIMKSGSFELGTNGAGIDVTSHDDAVTFYVPLTAEQRRDLADALVPGRDFSGVDWKAMYTQARSERDAAVYAYDKAERERDAAVARAEAAEKRHTWPKVTPTGHTYVEPRTYEALRHEHDNAAQAEVECWAADECPPEPTWEMVGSAHREVERLQRERDEWKFRAEQAENARDTVATRAGQLEKALAASRDAHQRSADAHMEWKARAEAAERERDELRGRYATLQHEYTLQSCTWGRKRADYEARLAKAAPAVTRDDVKGVIGHWIEQGGNHEALLDNLWRWVSGDDPAVHVVRESDVAAVKVERHEGGGMETSILLGHLDDNPSVVRTTAANYLQGLAEAEALARAIEAGQAVDPAEGEVSRYADTLAQVLVSTTGDEDIPEEVRDALRVISRHVLGQEDRHE